MARFKIFCVLLILLFAAQGLWADSALNDPDEGGIGGTGAKPEPLDIPEIPEVPEFDELMPEFEPDDLNIDEAMETFSAGDDIDTPEDLEAITADPPD